MILKADRQFYRVQRGPCWDTLIAWRKDRKAIDKRCYEFAMSVGGTGFYAGFDDNVGNATAISAITFAGEPPKGWKARRWSSFVINDGMTPAWPDKRTKTGKDALKAIQDIPLRPSSYRVCKEIGFPTSLEYSGNGTIKGSDGMNVFETAAIGWQGDTFYIGLPKISEHRQRLIDKGYTVITPDWSPLQDMEPIIKEEMELDMARAKLREKEAA